MCAMRFGNCRGFSFIMTMMLVPAFMVALSAVVLIGQVSIAKMRLQIAADRGAYIGAMTLAKSLNEIASSNRAIHSAFKSIRKDFIGDMQQSESAARERIERYQSEIGLEFQKVGRILTRAPELARSYALAVAMSNAPASELEVIVKADFAISDRLDPDFQWSRLSYDFVEGGNFADPEGVGHGYFDALSHLLKERRFDGWVAVVAAQPVAPLSLSTSYGGVFSVTATSAAKAYGGSIVNYAISHHEDRQSMSNEILPDWLYRAAMIPFELLKGGG